MSVTLQIKLNGGAPQTGGVTGAIGDVVQLTAANKSTWSGAATWQIYDYPPDFAEPSGWSTDADGVFYALGNADPPAFTISDAGDWGKYGFRVTVLDGGILTTDEATALSIPSPGGLKSIMAGESTQFGGTREKWVGDLKRDIRTLSAGSGTVAPTADTVAKRDAAGELYATSFKGGATGSTVVEATGASSDATVKAGRNVHLDAGNDVFLDVAAEGDAVRVQVNNVDAMTVTPTAGTVTLGTTDRSVVVATPGSHNVELQSGRDAIINTGAGRSTKIQEVASDIAVFTAAAITHTVDGLTETCTNSSGTLLCSVDAPLNLRAAGAIAVQPAQSTAGAGHRVTIESGPGQTPGTHLGGGIVHKLCVPVAGVTDEFEIQRSDGTKLLGVKQFASGYVWIDFGTNIADIRATSVVALRAPNAVQYVSPKLQRFDPSGANYRDESSLLSPATINTATDTNVGAGISINNVDSTELIECTLGWWNKTDSTCGWRKFRRAFKRVGGTVSAVGSLIEDDAGSYVEAGETGVTCDFTISGVTVIPRITTPDTDQRRAFAYVEQTKRLTW